MRGFVLTLAALFWHQMLFAQDDSQNDSQGEEVTLDQLAVPSSPGFLILGEEITSIEKPTNATDFIASVKNASDGFSSLPKNFAIEFLPFWVFGGSNTNYKSLTSNSVGDNIEQSFQVSIATQTKTTDAGTDSTQLGLGFKFSILRGDINDDFAKHARRVQNLLNEFNLEMSSRAAKKENEDTQLKALNRRLLDADEDDEPGIQKEIESRQAEILKEVELQLTKEKEELKNLATEYKFTRYGWKWDVAGAWALSFRDQNFDEREVQRFGIWTTFGYETKKVNENYLSFLGLARWIKNFDDPYIDVNDATLEADNTYIDTGLRLIYTMKEKLSVSGEYLYRQSRDIDEISSSDRYTLNVNYQLPKNKVVTFTYGKDFDGNITKDGNLIAAINLVVGLGSERSLK